MPCSSNLKVVDLQDVYAQHRNTCNIGRTFKSPIVYRRLLKGLFRYAYARCLFGQPQTPRWVMYKYWATPVMNLTFPLTSNHLILSPSMWSQGLFVWILAIYQALYGFIAQGICTIIKPFTTSEPAMELPISSKSTSFIPDCVPADGIRTCSNPRCHFLPSSVFP